MKNFIFISLLFCFSFSKAQNQAKTGTPGQTKVQKNAAGGKGKYQPATTQNLVNTMIHDTCLNKKFSLVFYIILDTIMPSQPNYPGVGLATPGNISMIVNNVNQAFKPICVSFEHCSTTLINNFTATNWKKSITEPIATSNWYTDNTINIYLVNDDSLDLGYGNSEKEGYTYEPSASNLANPLKNVIVMEKTQLMQGSGAIFIHLLGHFFGLTHTFEEYTSTASPPATSLELADGSNCTTNGDGFCDTEADPGLTTILTDANGQLYIHPIDNYMSYYTFRCRFSQEQYNRMAYIIATKRMYLH